ncbi:MAG: hypothetical protein HC898_00840 [Phycisphaerales bacterium]|nr:hypothetical protein [Phycisphaerales bacterium]
MTSAKFIFACNRRQPAVLSWLISTVVLVGLFNLLLSGCASSKPADELQSPYPTRHVWAVAPLSNLSGSLSADGLALADHLHRQLENAGNLDVLPVNRVIGAMEALELRQITTQAQALQLLQTLGVDGLVVGAVTAYDPYDPPKIGLTLELYTQEKVDQYDAEKLRALTRQPTEDGPGGNQWSAVSQPVAVTGSVLDASDPRTRAALEKYAAQRGPQNERDAWRRYRVSIDHYSEFVAYVMSYRLLDAERKRLFPHNPIAKQPADEPFDWKPITDPVIRKLEYIVE